MSRRPLLFAALFGLAALGATCKGNDAKPTPPPPPPVEPAADSPAVTELPGFDLAELEPTVRSDALRILNETFCYCGCTRTVASCLANREDCSCVRCSERMAKFIFDEYKSGADTGDVEAQLLGGFSEGYNGRPQQFDVTDQPFKGTENAPVTLVEFADFRCPHCADASEVLKDVVMKRSDVKLVYFYYPLSGNGEPSTRAAEAAEEARVQGNFWLMSDLLFANQHAFDLADLARYAQKAGLDLPSYEQAMAKQAHRDAVMADKRIGEAAGVKSTPAIYVNGRPFGLGRTVQNFDLRIDMELERGRCD